MTAAMYVPQFVIKQKLTMMVNRFQITAIGPDGSPGQELAFAEQKRMAFKEQVTFFTDSSRSQPVFSFKARKALDLSSGYDVTDAAGQPLGYFGKDFKASLLRSTFVLEGPGFQATGQERNQMFGLLRRFADVSFLPMHFDFVDADGHTVMTSERQRTIGDRYTVSVPDDRVDFRLAAAMSIGLDVLMAR